MVVGENAALLGGQATEPIWSWLWNNAHCARWVLLSQGRYDLMKGVPVTLSPSCKAIRYIVVTCLVHFEQLLYNYWYSPGQRCCKNVAVGEIGDVSTLGHWGEFKVSWRLCPCPCPSYSTSYHTMRSQPFLSALAPVSAFLVYVSPQPPPQTSILSRFPPPTTLLWVYPFHLALPTEHL